MQLWINIEALENDLPDGDGFFNMPDLVLLI